MTAVWLQYARDTHSQAREFAPIAALTGKADSIARTVALRDAFINAATGIASLAIGTFLARQFLFPFGGFFPLAFIASVGVIYAVFVVSQALLFYLFVSGEAASWIPGKSK